MPPGHQPRSGAGTTARPGFHTTKELTMLLSAWRQLARRLSRPARSSRTSKFFRPTAELLEARIVPDAPGLRTSVPGEGYLHFQADPSPGVNRPGDEWTGWIDARHPSLAGGADPLRSYDRSDRYVQIRTTILQDA